VIDVPRSADARESADIVSTAFSDVELRSKRTVDGRRRGTSARSCTIGLPIASSRSSRSRTTAVTSNRRARIRAKTSPTPSKFRRQRSTGTSGTCSERSSKSCSTKTDCRNLDRKGLNSEPLSFVDAGYLTDILIPIYLVFLGGRVPCHLVSRLSHEPQRRRSRPAGGIDLRMLRLWNRRSCDCSGRLSRMRCRNAQSRDTDRISMASQDRSSPPTREATAESTDAETALETARRQLDRVAAQL